MQQSTSTATQIPELLHLFEAHSLAELQQAYRRMALAHHPDRPGGSTRAMQSINEAYQLARQKLLNSRPEPERLIVNPLSTLSFEAQAIAAIVLPLAQKFNFELFVDDGQLWASGPGTYHAREKLKLCGFWWRPEDRAWQFVRIPAPASTNSKAKSKTQAQAKTEAETI